MIVVPEHLCFLPRGNIILIRTDRFPILCYCIVEGFYMAKQLPIDRPPQHHRTQHQQDEGTNVDVQQAACGDLHGGIPNSRNHSIDRFRILSCGLINGPAIRQQRIP